MKVFQNYYNKKVMGKTSWFIVFILVLNIKSVAQSYKANFPNSTDKRMKIIFQNADISIESHKESFLMILTDDNEPLPQRAKGLQPVNSVGTDNSGVGFSVTSEGDTLNLVKITNRNQDYTIMVPEDAAILLQELNWQGNDLKITGVKGELEVKVNSSNLLIMDISGPIVANTHNGDVEVVFSEMKHDQPSYIKSLNGFIDVTIPSSVNANLKASTMNGDIYSNLDIQIDASERISPVANKVTGKLNNGGASLNLNTLNGDIYIRKK